MKLNESGIAAIGSNMTIRNNTILGSRIGINAINCSSAIEENVVGICSGDGIQLYDGKAVIRGNTIRNNTGWGIRSICAVIFNSGVEGSGLILDNDITESNNAGRVVQTWNVAIRVLGNEQTVEGAHVVVYPNGVDEPVFDGYTGGNGLTSFFRVTEYFIASDGTTTRYNSHAVLIDGVFNWVEFVKNGIYEVSA